MVLGSGGNQRHARPAAGLGEQRNSGHHLGLGGTRPRGRRGQTGLQESGDQPPPAIVKIAHDAALHRLLSEHTPAGTRIPLSPLALAPDGFGRNPFTRPSLQGQPRRLDLFRRLFFGFY